MWSIYILANLRLCCPDGVAVPIPNRLQRAKAARKRRCILRQHIFWGYLRAADGLHIILRLQGFKIRLTRMMQLHHPFASTTVMVGLTFLVFIVFLTRCIYGFLQACGGHAMSDPVGTRREQWENLAASCRRSYVRTLDIVGAAPLPLRL